MKITYLGHSCFKLQTSTASFIFDPFADIGYNVKRVSADVVLCSHDHFDHNAVHLIDYKRVITDNVNEDVDGVKISSYLSYHDEVKGAKRGTNFIYKLCVEGKNIIHLGDLGFVDDGVISFIKNADVLLIPVGGTYTIDPMQARDLIYTATPKHVIPMHYRSGNSRINIAPLPYFTQLVNLVNYLPSTVDINELKEGINIMEIDN
ncbi:MAG: MBL fold metallo-hydrolase [Clostridiales bacterium]|nr:MBL fold metallo-hydrolase [Clostridiales bacterium]